MKGGGIMNKQTLIEELAQKTGLQKKDVETVIEAMLEMIIEKLKMGEEVVLTGFGAFMAKKREARMGVNPQSPSEKIQIPAVIVPKFKAGKTLKDALKAGV